MGRDTLELLRRRLEVLGAENAERRERTGRTAPLVTISRAAGTGGRVIANAVATALAVPVYDREILDTLAEDTGWDPKVLARIDENLDNLRGAWLRTILTGDNIFRATYRRSLINAILAISTEGGVILGRGGNFVLAGEADLRVRIVGARPRRVERRALELDCTPAEAEEAIAHLDQARARFAHGLFERDIDDPLGYDIVFNVDRISQARILRMTVEELKEPRNG